jgi:ribonuclease J
LRARIHRGTAEIGGSCVELEADGSRLVLDLGRPLSARPYEAVMLPTIEGLDTGDDATLLAVLVSHGHLDHWGLLPQVHPDVPVYCGEATQRVLGEAVFFSAHGGAFLEPRGVLRDRHLFCVGPFTVTPFLVDHSAFDAYAVLVEAGGRRLFYSGDLRAHGRKSSLFERLIAEQPSCVDELLLEGTTVGCEGGGSLSETELEQQLADLASHTAGVVAVVASAQNVDRLVSVYRAARRADRTLVVDLYTATIAAATGVSTIPQPGSHNVRVYVPQRQRVRVKRSGEFERVERIRPERVFLPELAHHPERFVVLGQQSTLPELARAGCLDEGSVVWSLWSGYLETPSGKRTRELLERAGISLVVLHASGHANVEDLQRFARAVAAGQVVPIHTDQPQAYKRLFERVQMRRDGHWWEV